MALNLVLKNKELYKWIQREIKKGEEAIWNFKFSNKKNTKKNKNKNK